MKRCGHVMPSSNSFLVLDFDSYAKSKLISRASGGEEGFESEFWESINQEMRLRLLHFKSKDSDLEEYITTGKFIHFERNFYCRNYFILSVSPQNCPKKPVNKLTCSDCCALRLKSECYKVLGYFTLAGKSIEIEKILKLPASASLGKMSKTPSKNLSVVETYLVGHLSKNYYRDYDNEISGHDVLIRSFETIKQANKLIGINIVRIDCGNDIKIIQFYKAAGFEILGLTPKKKRSSNCKSEAESENMVVMVKNLYS